MTQVDAVHGAYYVLLWPVVHVFGTGEFAVRFPSALAMAAAAYGIGALGTRLHSFIFVQLSAVRPGALVDVSGKIESGPLDRIVSLFGQILPFLEDAGTVDPAIVKIFEPVKRDLDESPVMGVLLKNESLTALIPANREYFSEGVDAALLGGTFTLVGKATAIDSAPDSRLKTVRR